MFLHKTFSPLYFKEFVKSGIYLTAHHFYFTSTCPGTANKKTAIWLNDPNKLILFLLMLSYASGR